MPKEPHDKHKPEENEDEDDFDDSDIGHLSSTDALWIPIVASVTLISLFLVSPHWLHDTLGADRPPDSFLKYILKNIQAFRYLDKDTINRLLSGYFHFAGFFMFARVSESQSS